jgi:hypothetical protein
MNVWWQRPGKRTAFRDRAPAPWFVTLAELGLALLIALASGLLAARQIAGFAPALAAVAILLALRAAGRPRGRRRAQRKEDFPEQALDRQV